MSGFISALIKQRRDAKKAGPDTSGRLKEIIDILRKYDYDDGITPEIVVGIIQDLGPTFVKIGQIASQQSEHIPPEYCDALAQLRSSVAPMDLETVHAQIEKYLGKPTDELFASFDDKPLGSASIGQVHKAELFDGTVVAVKVRRPGVVDTVARDFALIEKILDTFVKGTVGGFDIKGFITELEQTSKLELDFTNEAFNLERFRELNAARERVESPKCYREFTNEAILTESFVTGTEVGDLAFLETLDDEERDLLAELVADNFATQVLTDGFYHADPHSGNVLIKDLPPHEEDKPEAAESEETPEAVEPADGSASGEADEPAADEPAADEAASDEGAADDAAEEQPKLPQHSIEWIDFGMMGTLTAQQRQLLIDLVSNIVMHDAYALKRTVLKVATPQGEINHGALLEMCEGMCDQYTGDDFGDFALGDLLDTILSGLQDEEYKIDPFLTNLSRGIIAVEGTVRTLSPRVNILNNFMDKVTIGFGSGPELTDEEIEEMAPQIAMQAVKVLAAICTKGGETLDMLEKGQIRTRTDFAFEEKALGSVERLVGYAVRAVLIAAILIGSCLLCTVPINAMETTPFLIAFPVLGSIGYLVCVFFAYRLYRDVKNGK
ncbi:MAG: AarF/ABC1/UbiB kinase family protein [Atopobiaceae bacterium]|nr:AarF/ABC1/UbiB kinase family protein [Atopobiaceae bacterium]